MAATKEEARQDAAAAHIPAVQVFPVTIGHYSDPDWADLDTEGEAGRVVDLLVAFGGRQVPWAAPVLERDAGAVQRRLRDWADVARDPATPRSTVLYWAGHGSSDGRRAALAHGNSPSPAGDFGVAPEEFAYAIRARQAALIARDADDQDDSQGWALVIVDTCRSGRFARLVAAQLLASEDHEDIFSLARGVLLVGVSGKGATALGRFTSALRDALTTTYRADRRILLNDLSEQLRRLLPGCQTFAAGDLDDAALVSVFPPVASWMSAPLTEIRHLEEVLEDLAQDERQHFLVKAQGAEHGEMSWFFEGREQEQARIVSWLRQAGSGMQVVTGRAGSGKSALLGHVLVQSLPELRDALARRGLATPLSPGQAPPEAVFDAVIHLSGLTLSQATARVTATAGLGTPPSQRDPDTGVANDLDWLTSQLTERAAPFTVLADALDEALDPLDIARSLLARIAAVPGVRVLVGTRASTNESPDAPADDQNLLDALTAGAARPETGTDGNQAQDSDRVWVGPDQQAICRYVRNRLRAARDHGVAGRSVPYLAEISDEDIEQAAADVAARDREFLFARLAVYELIADARLLTPGRAASRSTLLGGGHQDLFARALDRLAGHDDRYPVLLQALSLARGRGVPEADGVWASIAAAVAPACGPWPDANLSPAEDTAWAQVISGLLRQAAAYITVDTDSTGHHAAAGPRGLQSSCSRDHPWAQARSQTVYRLAHRAFVEYFAMRTPEVCKSQDRRRRRAASALLHTTAEITAGDLGQVPAYLARHLSGHIAEADMWDSLADQPWVLDGLEPHAVTADAVRTLFGRRSIPPPVAGTIGAREVLATAEPADRAGLRHLSTTIHSPQHVIGEPASKWGIAGARVRQSTAHIRLSGHTGAVCRVRSLKLPDGRTVLASASDDGKIRLWDPGTATPIGTPMTGNTGTIEDICVLLGPHDQSLLASAGSDGTIRIWDPATGQPAGPPLAGHTGPIWGVCTLPSRNCQSLIATAGDDETVRIWDPAAGQAVGHPITGHAGPVLAVCALPGSAGHTLLATAGGDGTVRIWDPATAQAVGHPITGHTGRIYGICTLPGPDAQNLIATAGDDGTVRIWDPATSQPVGQPITGHTGRINDVCTLPGPDAQTLIATAGRDGTVRIWDPTTGQPIGQPITGHTGPVWSVCALPGPATQKLVATAGYDGTVRIWNPATGQPLGSPITGHTGTIFGVCALPGPDAQNLIATAGEDGTVRIWNPATGQPVGQQLTGHTGRIYGVCTLHDSDGQVLLVTVGNDGTTQIWNHAAGRAVGEPLAGASDTASSLAMCAPAIADCMTVTGDGTIHAWTTATASLRTVPSPAHSCTAITLAIDGHNALVTGDTTGQAHLSDPATGREWCPPLRVGHGAVLALCPLPGNPVRLAVAAGSTGAITLLTFTHGTMSTGRVLHGCHSGPIRDLCMIERPDGPPLLAAAGNDSTIEIWDLKAQAPHGTPLTGHNGWIWSLTALHGGPSGHPWLASASADHTIRLWDPVSGRPLGSPLIGHLDQSPCRHHCHQRRRPDRSGLRRPRRHCATMAPQQWPAYHGHPNRHSHPCPAPE